jgi:hypothetical protein
LLGSVQNQAVDTAVDAGSSYAKDAAKGALK